MDAHPPNKAFMSPASWLGRLPLRSNRPIMRRYTQILNIQKTSKYLFFTLKLFCEKQDMNAESLNSFQTKRPWHLWIISILSIIWYLSGACTIVMAQAGKLPGLSAEETAYYSAQPIWFIILTDISLFSALIASVALILKSRLAFWLFGLSLTTIYDLAIGTSRALANTGAMIATIIIVVIAILLPVYTWLMKKRSLLR